MTGRSIHLSSKQPGREHHLSFHISHSVMKASAEQRAAQTYFVSRQAASKQAHDSLEPLSLCLCFSFCFCDFYTIYRASFGQSVYQSLSQSLTTLYFQSCVASSSLSCVLCVSVFFALLTTFAAKCSPVFLFSTIDTEIKYKHYMTSRGKQREREIERFVWYGSCRRCKISLGKHNKGVCAYEIWDNSSWKHKSSNLVLQMLLLLLCPLSLCLSSLLEWLLERRDTPFDFSRGEWWRIKVYSLSGSQQ